MSSEEAIAVVRRNTEEVQGQGNYDVFEELFAKDFVDHTPQPGGFSADRDGARNLYKVLRTAFPDFHAEIHWQISDGDRVTTFKTYHGTHLGEFWGIAPTGKKISIRDRRCYARAKRQDQRSLGSGEPVLARAAVRACSGAKEEITDIQQTRCFTRPGASVARGESCRRQRVGPAC
jgi:predicted ester cyclase